MAVKINDAHIPEAPPAVDLHCFSHSRLNTYLSCPKKFAFRYIEQLPAEGEGIEAFAGKRAHEALEQLYQTAHAGAMMSETALTEYFEAGWRRAWNEAVRIVSRNATADDYRAAARQGLQRYYRRHAPFTANRLLATEQRIEIALDDTGDLRLQGFVDRIDEVRPGVLEIHDYKTSNRLPTQSALDADRQLALYEQGVRALFPETLEVTLVWHYLKFDRELRSQRTLQQLNAMKAEVCREAKAILEAAARNEFPTKKSRLCDWCDYRAACPAWPG